MGSCGNQFKVSAAKCKNNCNNNTARYHPSTSMRSQSLWMLPMFASKYFKRIYHTTDFSRQKGFTVWYAWSVCGQISFKAATVSLGDLPRDGNQNSPDLPQIEHRNRFRKFPKDVWEAFGRSLHYQSLHETMWSTSRYWTKLLTSRD